MKLLLAAVVGILAGVHTATWGMYKDAPHEGFSLWKYFRSIVLATAIAVVLSAGWGLDPRRAADLVVLFGATYAVERALAEIYKTFLRDEDQSKYFIPMQFAVFGRVVRSRGARLLAGAGYVAVLLAMVVLVDWVDRVLPDPMPVWQVVAIGGLGGWISAFGGAWKDAPKEGFQIFKFFRSPIIASLFALGLSYLSDDLVLVTLAATGFCVATTETYKTFFFPSVPRGKFAGMPVHFPDMLRKRQPFILVYAGIWLVVLIALVIALKGVPSPAS
ncbi:MAG TPA: hypothetical protein VG500_13665 [Gemmatimonadales bacterium]|jgi:hypothetical protein|nr:hypothetical protein [Gemmatimonadales bacterium]